MSTGYGWVSLRRVCASSATLFGARHVPERLCGGIIYLGALYITNVLIYLFLNQHPVGK